MSDVIRTIPVGDVLAEGEVGPAMGVGYVLASSDRIRARCIVTENEVFGREGRTAVVGWYEAEPDVSGQLLDEVCRRCASEGYVRVIGPMNGDTWHAYRAPTTGSGPTFFLDVATPSTVHDDFVAAGFAPIERYHSTVHSLDDTGTDRTEQFGQHFASRGITVRSVDVEAGEADIERIHRISIEAFAENPYFSPIPLDSLLPLYTPLLPILDPAFALIAESKEEGPLAFILAVPDHIGGASERLVIKTVAARETRGARGLGTYLVELVHRRARERGFRRVIHALMHDENSSTKIVANGEVMRRYVLFGREAG